jgi:hypothetical protein
MESKTGIVLVVFGVVLLALGMYIYILAAGSNEYETQIILAEKK